MLKLPAVPVAVIFALASTTAIAKDSWTDLEPRVRAAEQAAAAQIVRADQMQKHGVPSRIEMVDRTSPL